MSSPHPTNPLFFPTANIPFSQIEATHVEAAISKHISDGRDAIEQIVQRHASGECAPSWASIMDALDTAVQPLDWAATLISHLDSVRSSDELSAAYAAVRPEISGFYADIPVHGGLWDLLSAFAGTDEAQRLDPVRARALTKTVDEFRRHGAMLSEDEKRALVATDRELSSATLKFSQNVLEATSSFALYLEDDRRLEGVPSHVVEAAARATLDEGREGYKLTLHAPCVIPLLTYGRDRELREQLWRAYNRRAAEGDTDNAPVICAILKLRKKKASLLGYDDFADLILEDRMAATGERAGSFVSELCDASRDAFALERQELQDFARERDGATMDPLRPWDVAYYGELLRQARFDFDGEQLRPYFSAARVLEGMFNMVRRLYGVDVRAADHVETWQPSVHAYEVFDGEKKLGRFFADLYPRDEKRGGAWMHGLCFESEFPADGVGHLGLIAANVTAPSEGSPALLDHQEVETLFHEFGHLMHHLLTEVPIRSMAGTNVAWDFVELPSQIMENWCWNGDGLRAFAVHHESGAAIPEALFSRLLRSRTFRGGSQMMRQLGFASLDLALHREFSPESASPAELLTFCRERLAPFSTTELPGDESMICAFNHLFSSATGYAAGYYSYKWAEVLDADAFSAFAENGLFDREVGERFRRTILARGDAAPPEQLFEDFLGRPPRLAPLLERSGIKVTP